MRPTVEALAATLGGTQSLHTNAYDEALGLPTDESARVALHSQLILMHEYQLTRVVDPWGGSYFMESLTQRLVDSARRIVDEVEAIGGMTRAVAGGIPKRRIEEAAARRQACFDRGLDIVVGVNKYEAPSASPLPIRLIDNDAVRRAQGARLAELRRTRDEPRVARSLALLEGAAARKERSTPANTHFQTWTGRTRPRSARHRYEFR